MATEKSAVKLFGLNGDPWAAPDSTPEGIWSALGAGADGVCLNVYLTADDQVLCIPDASLEVTCGDNRNVDELTLAEIQSQCDAGATWNGTLLDETLQPTGERGSGFPWKGFGKDKHPKKPYLRHPSLQEMLRLFGRRTRIFILLPGNDYAHLQNLAKITSGLLTEFGLDKKVPIIASVETCKFLRDNRYSGTLVMDIRKSMIKDIASLQTGLNIETLFADAESLDAGENLQQKNVSWLLTSRNSFASQPKLLEKLLATDLSIAGLVSRAVLPLREWLTPCYSVFADDFAGTDFDQQHWAAGYSHQNQETTISHNDGIVINLVEGEKYSGAAAVFKLPVHGDFDASVDFEVAHPQQGTTFEMAAIGIDPGYHHPANEGLDSRSVNLTFDVHGAPPYASSERDQDNGFRCGWNNSFNFAKIDPDWDTSSANMYNKYGRDTGEGSAETPTGQLRLVRRGSVFNSYYRDRFNPSWVCSGSMLVQNLPDDAFIRLAGKHWHKIPDKPTPANTIRFTHFRLSQY